MCLAEFLNCLGSAHIFQVTTMVAFLQFYLLRRHKPIRVGISKVNKTTGEWGLLAPLLFLHLFAWLKSQAELYLSYVCCLVIGNHGGAE